MRVFFESRTICFERRGITTRPGVVDELSDEGLVLLEARLLIQQVGTELVQHPQRRRELVLDAALQVRVHEPGQRLFLKAQLGGDLHARRKPHQQRWWWRWQQQQQQQRRSNRAKVGLSDATGAMSSDADKAGLKTAAGHKRADKRANNCARQ